MVLSWHLLRIGIAGLIIVTGVRVRAQWDVGVVAGPFWMTDETYNSGGHDGHKINARTDAFPTVSLFYRDRAERGMGLGMAIEYQRRAYAYSYLTGGLGFGTSGDLAINEESLAFTLAPEVDLDGAHWVTIRFGLQFGLLTWGTRTGYRHDWGGLGSSFNYTEVKLDDQRFVEGGSLRGLLGMRFTVPCGAGQALVIEPFISEGMTSLLKKGVKPGSVDMGFRLGWALQRASRSLGARFGRMVPRVPANGQ